MKRKHLAAMCTSLNDSDRGKQNRKVQRTPSAASMFAEMAVFYKWAVANFSVHVIGDGGMTAASPRSSVQSTEAEEPTNLSINRLFRCRKGVQQR